MPSEYFHCLLSSLNTACSSLCKGQVLLAQFGCESKQMPPASSPYVLWSMRYILKKEEQTTHPVLNSVSAFLHGFYAGHVLKHRKLLHILPTTHFLKV